MLNEKAVKTVESGVCHCVVLFSACKSTWSMYCVISLTVKFLQIKKAVF